MLRKRLALMLGGGALVILTCFVPLNLYANEVNKGQIPADHLAKSYKTLPWGVEIWDVDEAVSHLKSKDKVLWIDTRPNAFFEKGSVRGAVLMPYNKTGEKGNELTKEKLGAALAAAGMSKNSTKIVFFCQGPKCHRSYNAAYITVTQWGFDPKNVIWFRDGYPTLFKKVKETPKLKRRAKRYISNDGISQL